MKLHFILLICIAGSAEGLSRHSENHQVLEKEKENVATESNATKPGTLRVALSYGGGGCHSVVSQLGFMRGLSRTVQNIENSTVDWGYQATHSVSSSGGTWALGMLYSQVFGKDFSRRAKAQKSTDLFFGQQYTFWEGPLGRWCDRTILEKEVPPKDWARYMNACAKCVVSQGVDNCNWGLLSNQIFGVGKTCAVSGYMGVQMTQMGQMMSYLQGMITPVGWTGTFEKYLYNQFYADLPVPVRSKAKLSDYNFPTKWIIHSSKYTGKVWTGWGLGKGLAKMKMWPDELQANGNRAGFVESVASSGDWVTALSMPLWYGLQNNICLLGVPLAPYQLKPMIKAQKNLADRKWNKGKWSMLRKVRGAIVGDGAGTDSNAIVPSILQTDKMTHHARPKIHIGMIAGGLADDTMNFFQVAQYFLPYIPFNDTIPGMYYGTAFCKPRKVMIANPNYIFKIKGKVPIKCRRSMFFTEYDNKCRKWNLWTQIRQMGTVLFQKVEVQRNEYWGIKGGWDTTLALATSHRSMFSEMWVKMALPLMQTQLDTLDFPMMGGPNMLTFTGMDHSHAFAKMSFASYQGMMLTCMITQRFGLGRDPCTLCKRYPAMCPDNVPNDFSLPRVSGGGFWVPVRLSKVDVMKAKAKVSQKSSLLDTDVEDSDDDDEVVLTVDSDDNDVAVDTDDAADSASFP